jgi:hypothetical protein
MSAAIFACFAAAVMTWAMPALAQLDRITQREALAGLKAALEQGSHAAIAALGRSDGFLANPQVRIPIPESLERTEKLVRRLGFSNEVDELVVAMNRAAEAAVPEARKLLVDAVKKMSARDAKSVLTGGDTAATQYFKRTTRGQLHARFLPIVQNATARAGVAQRYKDFAKPAAAFGLLKTEHADLDEYVTQKALDGLYFMLGEEEKKIRRDPVGSTRAIVRKVFGALP